MKRRKNGRKLIRLIAAVMTLVLSVLPLTGCEKLLKKGPSTLCFQSTSHVVNYEEEYNIKYTYDRMTVHNDGYIEVWGTGQKDDGEPYEMKWMYTSDGRCVGNRELEEGQTDYVYLFDDYFNYVPGKGGVLSVEGNTVYYDDRYEVIDVEGERIRGIEGFSNDGSTYKIEMNESGLTTRMEYRDSNGEMYFGIENTYGEIPVVK